MITHRLLAALVGLSLAAGTIGNASAQTAAPTATPSVSPSDTVAPTNASKSETAKKVQPRKHHARMIAKTHRKHVSLRANKHVATKQTVGKKVAGKHIALKVAHHSNKRFRLSHLVKRGTTKHV